MMIKSCTMAFSGNWISISSGMVRTHQHILKSNVCSFPHGRYNEQWPFSGESAMVEDIVH